MTKAAGLQFILQGGELNIKLLATETQTYRPG